MALRYFTLSSSLCAETIVGAWEVRLEKNMERVRAMVSISFYLYEVGSARAPKGFPWWTAGMKIDPRVPREIQKVDLHCTVWQVPVSSLPSRVTAR